jgi:hypothetical protein
MGAVSNGTFATTINAYFIKPDVMTDCLLWSYPHKIENLLIVVKNKPMWSDECILSFLLETFTFHSWLMILSVILFGLILMLLMTKLDSNNSNINVWNFFYNLLTFPSKRLFMSFPHQLFSIFWFLFIFIVIKIFTAQITSSATTMKMTFNLNSLADILKNSNLNLIWSNNTMDPYLRKHGNKVIQQIVKRFDSLQSKDFYHNDNLHSHSHLNKSKVIALLHEGQTVLLTQVNFRIRHKRTAWHGVSKRAEQGRRRHMLQPAVKRPYGRFWSGHLQGIEW